MEKLPLAALHAFESAARHESFVKAGDELRLTAAGISQHVRSVESWLGVQVFVRHSRGVSLTPSGREFARAVTYGLAHIQTSATQLKLQAHSRPVSIACIPSLATRWLIPKLAIFREDYPDIRINIVYALDARTPEAAGADLLICHGTLPHPDAVRLLGGETRPTCSAAFLARHGPFQKPADMLGCELLHDETADAWMRWFNVAGVAASLKPGPIFADFSLMAGSVAGGQGIALCPTALIADEIENGLLVTLFETPSDTDKAYWLVQSKERSRDAALLRDWLVGADDRGSQRAL